MELVGAHREALSALDSTVSGPVSEDLTICEEDSGMGSHQKSVLKEEIGHGQNGKTVDIVGQKGLRDSLFKKKKERKAESVFWSTGNISQLHMEELLCPLYCWHKLYFSYFK